MSTRSFLLDPDDWRRAGRPLDLVRVEGRALFTRRPCGHPIRGEAASARPDPRALVGYEVSVGVWRVELGRLQPAPGRRPRMEYTTGAKPLPVRRAA